MAEQTIVAKRIREAREFTGLSKEQFALAAGTTRRNLIRWEYDQHKPTTRSLALIAEASGVSVDWLTGVVEDPRPRASSHPSRAGKQGSRSDVSASNGSLRLPTRRGA